MATAYLPPPTAAPQQRGRAPLLIGIVTALLIAGQAAIDDSGINVYCSTSCAAATAIVFLYCLRRPFISRFPLSTFAVLGFAVTNYSLPLIAQTLDRKPLIYNLLSPRATFEATLEFQAVIVAAHFAYTNLRGAEAVSQFLARKVLRPLWIFRVPRAAELWLLGMLGLVATWVSRILYVGDVDFGNVGGKFLQALVPFIVAPIFIPFRGRFTMRPVRDPPLTTPLLVGYFGVVVVTAVAFNARAIFAVVMFTALLAVGLMSAMGRLTLSKRARLFAIGGLLVAVPFLSVAQDLATAMQIARGLRGTGTTTDIVAETARAFGNREELDHYRETELAKTSQGGYSGYSEIYLDSEFLQRLTYTKYTDLTMTSSLGLTQFQRDTIKRMAHDQIISILPTPLINAIGFDVNKSEMQYSTGDVYADFAFNQPPGGERTGSSITNTMDVLGPLWAPVVFLIFIVTFTLFDSYALKTEGRTTLSTISFILLYEIFARGLIYDSFRNLIDEITRSYVQALAVYTVLALGARLAVSVVWPEQRRAAGGARPLESVQ